MVLFGIILAVIAFLFLAPREKVVLFWHSAHVRFPFIAQAPSSELKKLQQQLADYEACYSDLVAGAEKTIVFSAPSRPNKTRYCVLYLHGFSASRQELTPIPETIAKSLHANYYGARLTGHGLDGPALGGATANDWIYDANEAFQVARTLGEKVIVIATSTGATLATWMAQQIECQKALAALVFVSPNYAPKHWASPLFLWPFARHWLPLLSEDHGWEPGTELMAKYWTYRYPITVLFGLHALVKAVRDSEVERITTPSLFIYSDHDETVKARCTDRVFRRWGSRVKHRIAVPPVTGGSNHVCAGDITRPDNNEQFIAEILSFIKRHAND